MANSIANEPNLAAQIKKNKLIHASTPPEAHTPEKVKEVKEPEEIEEVKEQRFQSYSSARIAMRLITDTGKKIIFTGYEFLTQDHDLIDYLDKEIKLGLVGITKGKLLSLADRDPMAILKKKHIAEYEEQKAQEAANASKGITRNMGDTEGTYAKKINPVTSGQVAN